MFAFSNYFKIIFIYREKNIIILKPYLQSSQLILNLSPVNYIIFPQKFSKWKSLSLHSSESRSIGFLFDEFFLERRIQIRVRPVRCNFLFDHLQVSYKQVNECKLIQMAWPHSPIEKNLIWDVMDYPFASKRTSPILCLT